VFHAANLAVWSPAKVVDFTAGPSLSLHAAAFVVHSSLELSRRGLIWHETIRYLDGLNGIFFKPRGLYAMIMTYKPDSDTPIEEIKPSDADVDAVNKRNEGAGSKFGRSSGKTHSEMAIPESAPLVYPFFDAMSEEKKENKLKDATYFFKDRQDRKARARYVRTHLPVCIHNLLTSSRIPRFRILSYTFRGQSSSRAIATRILPQCMEASAALLRVGDGQACATV
jgi:hypothetical protein